MTGLHLSGASVSAAFDPTDVGYDVILSIGQSNEKGVNTDIDATWLDTIDPRVKQYPAVGAYAGQVIAAADPLFHIDNSRSGVGHVTGFARELTKQTKLNRALVVVPYAWPSTGFTTTSAGSPPAGFTGGFGGSWDPANGSGGVDLLGGAIAQTNALLALDPKHRIVAVTWLQGEADAAALTQAQYAAKLDAMIDRLRAEITGATSVPFILGQQVPEGITATPARANINLAHIDTPRRKTLTGFAYGPTGKDGGTALHYTAAGQRLLVPEYIKALARAKTNVTGTAPLPPSAVTAVQSGTSVVVTITRPTCRATRYLFEYQIGSGSWTTFDNTANPLDKTATLTGFSVGNVVTVRVSTVNEQGTSSTLSAPPVTVVAAPGQVVGLAAGTATASQQPLSWTALTGATGYLVEYKKHADSTWLTSSTVTTTSASVIGLIANTSYDYRVTGTNPGGSGTASATTTGSTAALSELLTDMAVTSGATTFYAIGVRKLVAAYAGSAIRVRRSSDSTELDIGFVGKDLDESAATTFAGAGDLFVKTWYDQSGNGRNVTISTTTAQPRLATAGVLNKVNGKVAVNFNGTTHGVEDSSTGLSAAGQASLLHVARTTGATGNPVLAGERGSTLTPLYGLADMSAAGRNFVFIRDDSSNTLANLSNSGALLTGSLHHATANVDDGVQVTTNTDGAVFVTARSSGTITITQRCIGKYGTAWWSGDCSEIVAFTGALSTAEVARAQANQKSYYGTV